MPGPRNWYANLRAHPRFVVHLKRGVRADLPATAAPVDGPTRRRVITEVLELQHRPDIAARASRRHSSSSTTTSSRSRIGVGGVPFGYAAHAVNTVRVGFRW